MKRKRRRRRSSILLLDDEPKKLPIKTSIFFLLCGLFLVGAVIVFLTRYLYQQKEDSYYPAGNEEELEIYGETADVSLKSLDETDAMFKAENAPHCIYPMREGQVYDFESDVYVTVATDLGGNLIVCKGSSDLERDLDRYVNNLIPVVGNVGGTFLKKNEWSEHEGLVTARFVSGKMQIESLIYEGAAYITACNVKVNDTDYVDVLYSTMNIRELPESDELIRLFLRYGFEEANESPKVSYDAEDGLNVGPIDAKDIEDEEEFLFYEVAVSENGVTDGR